MPTMTQSTKEELVTEMSRDCSTHIVLKSSFRGKCRLWQVLEHRETGVRHIRVTVMKSHRGEGVEYNTLHEDMGPYYYDCPLKYLEMVPVANEEWREEVRKAAGKKQDPKPVIGTQVKLIDCISLHGKDIGGETVKVSNVLGRGKYVVKTSAGPCQVMKKHFDIVS